MISPLAHDYCDTCNRVRLSADGRLKLCLFGDHLIDLRTPLRNNEGEEAIVNLLRSAMHIKPERHHLQLGETASMMRAFSEIGGYKPLHRTRVLSPQPSGRTMSRGGRSASAGRVNERSAGCARAM